MTITQDVIDVEEKVITDELRAEFDEAEYEFDFIKMQDVIDRARKIEYLDFADELKSRYRDVYNNPSKYDDER